MNCLLVMKIKWSLDINTGAVERSEAARARRLAGATVVGDDVIASTGYMKKQPLYERRVDLEVEGVRYIEMHFGPAAYVLGPPPSRGRDLELEGGVNACHVEYVYESETPTCEVPSNGVVEIS